MGNLHLRKTRSAEGCQCLPLEQHLAEIRKMVLPPHRQNLFWGGIVCLYFKMDSGNCSNVGEELCRV